VGELAPHTSEVPIIDISQPTVVKYFDE